MSQISGISAIFDTNLEQMIEADEDMGPVFHRIVQGVDSPSRDVMHDDDLKIFAGSEFPVHIPNFTPYPYDIVYPPSEPVNLCNDEFIGHYNFEVYIVPNELKTPWEYSPTLNKIFIGMGLKFPVAFSVKNRPDNLDLFVRSTPVFSQSQHFQEIVHRCIGHEADKQNPANKDMPEEVFQHIMRCSNANAKYYGNRHQKQRLNIVMPLSDPQIGSDIVREYFQFVCKNSCPSGMNRRPIEVIFTLEDSTGIVLGRRVLCVRICSCPRRDREKEEKELNKESSSALPQGKKRRVDHRDREDKRDANSGARDVTIYPTRLNIPGKDNYIKLLETGCTLMEAEMHRCTENGGSKAPFKKSFEELKKLLERAKIE